MFGPIFTITTKTGLKIVLRPLAKSEMGRVATMMSNPEVSQWTGHVAGLTIEDETEWYEKTRTAKDSYHWCISLEPTPENELGLCIGVTGIHGLGTPEHSCSSGIIIYDQAYWGKGVASASHIVRTSFAATTLNVLTIKSTVYVKNEASYKALTRVGYATTGIDAREYFRNSEYHDIYRLKWFNPKYIEVLYPNDSMPKQYESALENAKKTLEMAKTMINK